MQFELITKTARSLTIELSNQGVYYAPEPYDVLVDGSLYLEGVNTNVCSVFGLLPEKTYVIEVRGLVAGNSGQCKVTTLGETYRLDVRKFGAKGDGEHLDSPAIQAAILSCPIGGTIRIPKGAYRCGPLFLKSHITIELEKDAVLLGETDRSLYPILPGYTSSTKEDEEYYLGTWEGNPLDSYASIITGIGVVDTFIIGQGTIDGNAQNSDWWLEPKKKKDAWRPRTIFLKGCKNVTMQGVTVRNSPSWTIHPYLSEKLAFIDLTVVNHKDSPNTDGLDPESCSDVDIIGVSFSVGDDCIAIKSGKLYMGKKLQRPSERFVIRNCRMQHGHGAVVIGSEMSGGVREISVEQCLFEATDRGLRIKTRRGRGEDAIVDGISFDTIEMKGVLTPFVINMFYFCDPDGKTVYVWSKDKLAVDEMTPKLGRFSFSNIICHDSEVCAGYFAGLPEQPIEAIMMKDVTVAFKEDAGQGIPAMMSFSVPMKQHGFYAENVGELHFENVTIKNHLGEVLTATGIDRITGEDINTEKE